MAVGRNWAGVGLLWIAWRPYADSLVSMNADQTPHDLSEPEVTAEHMGGRLPRPLGVGDGCV